MKWDGKPRAFAPTDAMRPSRDVVSPAGNDAKQSPFPFALGVYTVPDDDDPTEPAVPLPLYYVSEQVANDRSEAASAYNAPGVCPGWYLIARPATLFSVRITKVNSRKVCKSHNFYQTSLRVGGVCSNDTHLWGSWQTRDEEISHGFVEESNLDSSGNLEKVVRPFFFQKADCTASATEEIVDQSAKDNGSIAIRVRVGTASRNRNPNGSVRSFSVKDGQSVGERAISKYGISLKVSREMRTIQSSSKTEAAYSMKWSRKLPEANIRIFVREASWMRSRRLIDNDGSPCSHQRYNELIQQDNARRVQRRIGGQRERPTKKRRVRYVVDLENGDGVEEEIEEEKDEPVLEEEVIVLD